MNFEESIEILCKKGYLKHSYSDKNDSINGISAFGAEFSEVIDEIEEKLKKDNEKIYERKKSTYIVICDTTQLLKHIKETFEQEENKNKTRVSIKGNIYENSFVRQWLDENSNYEYVEFRYSVNYDSYYVLKDLNRIEEKRRKKNKRHIEVLEFLEILDSL